MSLFWAAAMKRVRAALSHRHIPYLAMAAAFSFLIQMFNIPIPGGTTGHAVGGAVVAILLGPWAAVLALSVVLLIQAVVFGDGGITAFGANCFTMAVIMPFISYGIFRLAAGTMQSSRRRLLIAAFFSGYIGLVVAAIATAFLFGIQPLIAHDAQGQPLYAPYPLSVAISVMAAEHLLLFGIVEGIVTAMIIDYFMRHDPELIWAVREG
jgi:cobalt/nickel transport system permease protein